MRAKSVCVASAATCAVACEEGRTTERGDWYARSSSEVKVSLRGRERDGELVKKEGRKPGTGGRYCEGGRGGDEVEGEEDELGAVEWALCAAAVPALQRVGGQVSTQGKRRREGDKQVVGDLAIKLRAVLLDVLGPEPVRVALEETLERARAGRRVAQVRSRGRELSALGVAEVVQRRVEALPGAREGRQGRLGTEVELGQDPVEVVTPELVNQVRG